MILALCGYMGAGKSTLGRRLAKEYGWQFVDLDNYIEEKANMLIPNIFDEYGEKYFRKIETDALKDFIAKDNIVLALGGGTVISDENKNILKSMKVVYLDVDFDTCYERICSTDRPIVKQKSKEELQAHYNDRLKHYLAVANYKVDDYQGLKGIIENR